MFDGVGRWGVDGDATGVVVAFVSGSLVAPDSRVGVQVADGNRGGSAGAARSVVVEVGALGATTAGGRGALGRAATTRRVQSCHLPANSPQRAHLRWLPRIPLTGVDYHK